MNAQVTDNEAVVHSRMTEIYYTEPDDCHVHLGWYFQTAMGFIRGPFTTREEAFHAAAKEIEL